MRIIGIDPGNMESAYVRWDTSRQAIESFAKVDNVCLLADIRGQYFASTNDVIVLEQIACMGMAVGEDVLETVHWSGRFHEAMERVYYNVVRMKRHEVKMALCGSTKAKDSNIVTAIVDRIDPTRAYGKYGKGTKKNPGPCFGMFKDCWQAMALAITYELRP